ncbi:MAG TPA: aldehyde dehydrogenase family protein [Candidatus Paceibacterota bacterium]|jgi:succinate-semialdehyde dehydrogenase/glutarate-semialdehyde dehydrogenase|nr:aldehyde dehydrogenase family protein [Candidatus Paceibacterota bacterium]
MTQLRSINPHDGSVVGEVMVSTPQEVAAKVAAARAALSGWRDLGVAGRVAILRYFVKAFSDHAEEFAQLATKEMGMPIAASRDDTLGYFTWYLDNAEKYLAPEVTFEDDQEIHTVYREPAGVVAAIAPWNYPASNFVWVCGQNLIAGNTVVFKHSEETPLCGQLLEKIMAEANLPEGVFSEVYGGKEVGEALIAQDINLVQFTGSTRAGKELYAKAAQKMLKINMELGGSAPGIVFEDADLDEAVGQIYGARFYNSGQSCDALKRLLVHESVYDVLVEKLANKLKTVKVGDPSDPAHDMGPLVAERQVILLESQVADALEKGAQVVVGGKRHGSTGAYYEPTLLVNLKPHMRVWREEVFGPVLPIAKFDTEEKAIRMANDTDYGLGSYVYTKDATRAQQVAAQLQAGMVSINGVSYNKPSNPFGGYKHSGLGREHGHFGFEDVTQIKVVAKSK